MRKVRGLAVVGTFDSEGGKSSSIAAGLVAPLMRGMDRALIINGGPMSVLKDLVRSGEIEDADVILWMPNVGNAEKKFLPTIKAVNRRCVLISSKRVVERNYTEMDVVGRLLKSHSNLGIMITREVIPSTVLYNFRLVDPLGNVWCHTSSAKKLGDVMAWRVGQLLKMTRIGSKQVGPKRRFSISKEFLHIVREYGAALSKIGNAVNPNRFLGNAATRCSSGFPGVRLDNRYFVSRRNVDKNGIASKDFVEVHPRTGVVEYLGRNKPSVDTPIQIRLFNYYRDVNYIIHGHAYASGWPTTKSAIPCGSIEEFDEITDVAKGAGSGYWTSNICLNLEGHGFIILARDIGFLHKVLPDLQSRPFPEEQIPHIK